MHSLNLRRVSASFIASAMPISVSFSKCSIPYSVKKCFPFSSITSMKYLIRLGRASSRSSGDRLSISYKYVIFSLRILICSCSERYLGISSFISRSVIYLPVLMRLSILCSALFHEMLTFANGDDISPRLKVIPFASWFSLNIPPPDPPVPYSFFRKSARSFLSVCS